ncbi:MAG: hypothetical protein CM15mP49_25930 [Actinomycetota bacterium]|nr:MAG: hypothetical protein CM15mP49_25930 [Actinomycetota bacterium]
MMTLRTNTRKMAEAIQQRSQTVVETTKIKYVAQQKISFPQKMSG